MPLNYESVLTCPICKHKQSMIIPSDTLKSYTCHGCGCEITAPENECCIFCAYGSQKCMVQQGWQLLERKRVKQELSSEDKKDKVQRFIPALGYNFLTRWYDITIRLTMPEKKIRGKLIALLDPRQGERILEFGFGTGANLSLAVAKMPGGAYFGLDVDPKVRSIAFSKLKHYQAFIELDLYDGKTFPYQNNVFDKVYSCLVFHHIDRQTKIRCLQEINRVLKPGGELIIGDWGKAKSTMMRIAFYLVQLLDGFKTTHDNVKGKIPEYMQAAGFAEVSEPDYINTKIGSFCYYKGVKKLK